MSQLLTVLNLKNSRIPAQLSVCKDDERFMQWLNSAQELMLANGAVALLEKNHLLVHAGVLPQWSVAQTLAQCRSPCTPSSSLRRMPIMATSLEEPFSRT